MKSALLVGVMRQICQFEWILRIFMDKINIENKLLHFKTCSRYSFLSKITRTDIINAI